MATKVAITLRKKPNKAGLFPLAIRITVNRYPVYRQFGVNLKLKDWDDSKKRVKNSHPEADAINELILEKLLTAHKEYKGIEDTAQIIAKKKARKKGNNYFEAAQVFLDELEAKKDFGRLETERGYVNYLKTFYKAKILTFEQIDVSFLKRFKNYLLNKRNLKETSALNVLIQIRTLFNRALDNEMVKKEHYPFGMGKNKIKIKFPETEKIGWTKEEIIKLRSLTGLSEGEQHALNIWLYAFNFAGMRISDVLNERWNNFRNGRHYYRMGKNNKLTSLIVPEEVYGILEQYESDKRFADDFIFPEMKKANPKDELDIHRKKKTATKKINRYLKKLAKKTEVEKPLTTHIARHSFGHIAGEEIHPKKLQKLYRHSDLATTMKYQANFIHSDADEALTSVVSF